MKNIQLKNNNISRSKASMFGSFFVTKKKRIINSSISMITILTLVGGIYYNTQQAQGVDFTFSQSSWSGGLTTDTATHADNQTGWNQYSAKDPNISVGSDLQLVGSTASADIDYNTEGDYVQQDATSGTDFGAGVVGLHGGGGGIGAGGSITYTDSNGANPRTSPAYNGGYVVHTFTSGGTFVPAGNTNVDYLVVAGGGGGGASVGGGGGAGGFRTGTGYSVLSGNSYAITVGNGGSGLASYSSSPASSGQNSIFGTITSIGGGGGGGNGGGSAVAGGSGGSGGGGGNNGASGTIGGSGTSGQGNAGGNSNVYTECASGGGGGAGSVGQAHTSGAGGNGGAGIASDISGMSVVYAGGGGAGGGNYGGTFTAGTGGVGGGGNGSYITSTPATSGTANTGGGGGGGGYYNGILAGANGGSGIVIIRYPTSTAYPTTPYYITTSTNSQKNTSTWSGITGITTTQTTPTDTNLKYLVSFDNKTTWKYWNGSAWQTSTLGNIETNGMTKTTLEGISSANWSTAGGFIPGTLDIATSLSTTNNTATPTLDNIKIDYISGFNNISVSITKTTDSDFNTGTFSGTTVNSTGTNANVQLQQQILTDGGTGVDGAYSCTTGICNLVANTYNYTTFNISSGATVHVTGTNALVIKTTGDVTISGVLDLAGGSNEGCSGGAGGGGGGGNGGVCLGVGQPSITGGGAGGGAGNASSYGGQGGGSAGGGGGGGSLNGGAGGGGTVYINSNQNITVTSTGVINASGAAANGNASGTKWLWHVGGDGAGGKIVLSSAAITNNGTIDAHSNYYNYGGAFGIITLKYNSFSGTIPSGSTTPGLITAYPSTATYVSDVFNAGQQSQFTTLDYSTTLNGQTITVDARAGNTATPDGSWTSWQTGLASGGDINALSNNQYFQYRINFATSNNTITPTLNDITFNYQYLSDSQTLISSPYNTELSVSNISNIGWTETLPVNTDIQFQLRTSPDGNTWGPWCGPDDSVDGTCNSSTYFTDPVGNESIDDIQKDRMNDQFIQYKIILTSTDGINTPTLQDVSLTYATVSAPTVSTNPATNTTFNATTLSGNIINTGGENPERIVEYGTVSGSYTDQCTANTGTTGAYSCNLTNLTPETTYYFRAKATNSEGTNYGTEMTFTTLPPIVIINDPDTTKMTEVITNNYATVNSGSITATPSVTTNVGIIFQDGIFDFSVPQNTQITKTDSGNFNFQNFVAENKSVQVKQEISTSIAAIKIGINNTKLSFSNPITLSIEVGSQHNGRGMDVFYQNEGESQWHSQSSCTITDGKCVFQTNHATTYTVNLSGSMVGETGINLNTDVQEVIALDCGTSIVNMGNLTPGTPVTGSSTCLTTTNANGGYNLSVRRDDSTDTTMDKTTEEATNITDKAAWNPTTPNAQTWTGTGLGFTVYDSTANKNTTWWGTGATVNDANNLYAGFSPTNTDIMRHTTYSSLGTTTSIGYKLDVPPSQKSGAYSGAITYQVVTTP